MKKQGKTQEEAPVVRAARALAAALEEIELLTARTAKVEHTSAAELERSAELLRKAEAEHRAFLAHLASLAGAVEDARSRQNASAVALSQHEERWTERRAVHAGLEQRLAAVAEAAQAMTAALTTDASSTLEGVKAGMHGVRERLAATVEEARVLTADAREAGMVDVEKRAHAIRQQLGSLLRKIEQALGN